MLAATLEQVRAWRDAVALSQREAGAEMFMGKPRAWFENVHWFCPNGHVSGVFLKSEDTDRCLACRQPVLMGPAVTEQQFSQIILPVIKEL